MKEESYFSWSFGARAT